MSDTALRMLKARLLAERDHSRRDIESFVRSLQSGLKSALDSVDAEYRVDPHLIANASMLTAAIARWNNYVELATIVDQIDRETK